MGRFISRQLCGRVLLQIRTKAIGMGIKCSINNERQVERGGRDGNGKKDEVIPVGAACAGLLNPSILLHLLLSASFFHHFAGLGWFQKNRREMGGG